MEAREARLRQGLGRVLAAWLLLARSKRALLGITIIVFFSLVSALAPVLATLSCGYSCDPVRDLQLADTFAAPTWLGTLGLRKGLSQNVFLASPEMAGFDSRESLDGWTLGQSSNRLEFSHAATVGDGEPGSLRAAIVPRGPFEPAYGTFNFTIERKLTFPYEGPPGRFLGSVSILLRINGSSPLVQAVATLSNGTYAFREFWQLEPINEGGVYGFNWIHPTYQIDSQDNSFKPQFRRYAPGGTVRPEKIVFDHPGEYTFRVAVIIHDTVSAGSLSGSIFVDDVNLKLLGTSFGLLGTDHFGRDLFSQLVYGARISLVVGLAAAGAGVAIGLIVGLIAGFRGGAVDEGLMRFTDMLLVLPGLPLLLVLIEVLSPGLWTIIGVLALLGWMGFARVIRSSVVSLKERAFVDASRSVGAGTGHIVTRHILPNVMGLTYISLAQGVPGAIVAEAALSFLGLFDPNVMSWGRMISIAENQAIAFNWWWVLPPGLSIALLALSFILIGYALDDILNPRLRRRR